MLIMGKRVHWLALYLLGAAAVSGADLHVSPEGDDAHSGTSEQPFRTLSATRDTSLEAVKEGEAVTVWIHPGRYPVTRTLHFGPEFAVPGVAQSTVLHPTIPDRDV